MEGYRLKASASQANLLQGLSAPEERLIPTFSEHEPFHKEHVWHWLNLVLLHTSAISSGKPSSWK